MNPEISAQKLTSLADKPLHDHLTKILQTTLNPSQKSDLDNATKEYEKISVEHESFLPTMMTLITNSNNEILHVVD